MVFHLRKGAFLAISLLLAACPAQEASPTADEPGTPEPETQSTAPSYPAVPELNSILSQLDPECTTDGCVRTANYFGAYDLNTVNGWLPSAVKIENGYSVWQITYATHGREARATICLPLDMEYPENGFHVVLNNPLTVGVASRCASGESAGGAGLAAQFGTHGMVGVAVDYPGLGTAGIHPYLVAESEAMSTLDGARATLNFLEFAQVPSSKRLAFTGLSQGGHATLSAAAMHQQYAPELDIRGFAVAAPSSLFLELWTPYINTDGYHLTFYALISLAWSQHYGYPTDNIFYEPRREEIESAILSYCLYEEQGDTLWEILGTSAENIFSEEYRNAFSTGDFSNFPALELGFAANRVMPYEQTAPLRIYQGTLDATVPAESTQILVQTLQEAGLDIQYEEVPFGEHLNTAFGYIITYQLGAESSLHWLNGQLNVED